MSDLIIIGGGLAGSEAAWQAANRGLNVDLYEMRPNESTGAHISADLAELVCSNSLGSDIFTRASGLLKAELRLLNSLLIQCADSTSVPAGGALAVDRKRFAEKITKIISEHKFINVIREECTTIPDQPTIIATGPLTSSRFSDEIARLTGKNHLYFFDAQAPIVTFDSINLDVAYRASRYQKNNIEAGDYLNCPLKKEQYDLFIQELINAERIPLKEFELEIESGVKAGPGKFFEGCLPIEILAKRGEKALAFGPMRPVGLEDPRTGNRHYAVVQLRQDNKAGTLYNLVGFQTNLKFSEQERVFRLIPGLESAQFSRFGQMHRNTFIHSPELLLATLQYIGREDLFFAGQITGIEGYAGNIASGLLAGWNAARLLAGKDPIRLPITTMIGSLCDYITSDVHKAFQPMKANFGIMPPLSKDDSKRNKRDRAKLRSMRSIKDLENFLLSINDR